MSRAMLMIGILAVLTAGCSGTGATDAHVTMTGGQRFDPTHVEIPVGGTVTWRNDGHRGHTVTAIDADREPTGAFDSGEVIGTGTFTHTFDVPGVYRYQCMIHAGEMVGLVEVRP